MVEEWFVGGLWVCRLRLRLAPGLLSSETVKLNFWNHTEKKLGHFMYYLSFVLAFQFIPVAPYLNNSSSASVKHVYRVSPMSLSRGTALTPFPTQMNV